MTSSGERANGSTATFYRRTSSCYVPTVLLASEDHVVVIVAAIPTILAALAAFIQSLRNGRKIEATRTDLAIAHEETQAAVADNTDKVVSAAQDAATTATEVKAALDEVVNGGPT